MLTIKADSKTTQAVNLRNPVENACAFVLTLTLEGGEILWAGKAIYPGVHPHHAYNFGY